MEEVRDQFSDLLQAYRRYHGRDESDPEDGGVAFKEHAKVALDTFGAAFPHRLAEQERFLLDESEEDVLETLLIWTKESSAPIMEGSNGSQKIYTVVEAKQCSTQLMELTSESDHQGQAAVWPFIQKIRSVSKLAFLKTLQYFELTSIEFT
jgi:hypothetical protein